MRRTPGLEAQQANAIEGISLQPKAQPSGSWWMGAPRDGWMDLVEQQAAQMSQRAAPLRDKRGRPKS